MSFDLISITISLIFFQLIPNGSSLYSPDLESDSGMSGMARGGLQVPGYHRQSSQHSYYYPSATANAPTSGVSVDMRSGGSSYYGQPMGRQHRTKVAASGVVRRQESLVGVGSGSGGRRQQQSLQSQPSQQQHYQVRRG